MDGFDLVERAVTLLLGHRASGSLWVGATFIETLGDQFDEFVAEAALNGIVVAGTIVVPDSGMTALWVNGDGAMAGCSLDPVIPATVLPPSSSRPAAAA